MYKKRKSTVPVRTIPTSVIKVRRISRKELSSRLAAFCGDFEVYEGREVYHREFLQMKENETNGRNAWFVKVVRLLVGKFRFIKLTNFH